MSSIKDIAYGRYVDDFYIFSDSKEKALEAIKIAREELAKLGLILHPKKVYIQPARHGLTFIGTTIKNGRLYAGNRTIGNAVNLIRFFNEFGNKEENIESFAQRYNSYMGYLIHRSAYSIRWNLWRSLNDDVRKYVYIEDMHVLKVKNEYKTNYKIIQKIYAKKTNRKGGVGKDKSSV